MEIKSKLRTDIPRFVYEIKQLKDIIDAIQPELDELHEQMYQMRYDVHITTTKLISRFEELYEIVPDDTKTDEERVAEILNKRNLKLPFTWDRLNNLIQINYGTDYEILYDWSNYVLEILCLDNKLRVDYLIAAIEKAKPAHLAFLCSLLLDSTDVIIDDKTIIISYLIRRCGTFYGGTDPI